MIEWLELAKHSKKWGKGVWKAGKSRWKGQKENQILKTNSEKKQSDNLIILEQAPNTYKKET